MKRFELGDKYASVGFVREDGDFELLATFNNSGGYMTDQHFFDVVNDLIYSLKDITVDVIALPREDATDIVMLDEDDE